MKFLRKLLQEKAMAETMRDNKVTINPDTSQYHLVVFLAPRLASYNYLLSPYGITIDFFMTILPVSIPGRKVLAIIPVTTVKSATGQPVSCP